MSDKKEKVNKEVEELKTQVIELEDKWKRSMADYHNFKKRAEQDRDSLISFANMVLIKNLIPVIDNLQLASKHTEDVGIKMISTQFEEILKTEGVTKVEAIDKDFDANTMEAVEKDGEEGLDKKAIVTEVTKDGYVFQDKIIRPAQVVVTYK